MGTDIVAVDTLIRQGRALVEQGEQYIATGGFKFIAAREAAGGFTLAYQAALKRGEVSERTERRAIQFAKNPSQAVIHREKEAARDAVRNATRSGPDRNATKKINNLPAVTVSAGELHEATRGMKAMIRKAAIAGDHGDWRKSREQRTVAFAHFKKLLSASNLPALMGMTADEIIELIRTI